MSQGGTHVVQLLRTYPDLRFGRDYGFANGGERSVARGYTKAIQAARRLVYLEDQYVWGHHVGDVFTKPCAPIPTCTWWRWCRCHPTSTDVAQARAARPTARDAGDARASHPSGSRSSASRTTHGTPVYVHAKTCIVDDTWATVGSDNFNRRSWTHDSELSAVVIDRNGPTAATGSGSG